MASAVSSLTGSVWEAVRQGAAFNACSLPVGSCLTFPAKSGVGKGVKGRSFFRRARFPRVRWKIRSSARDDAIMYWAAKELGDLFAGECECACRRLACPAGVDFATGVLESLPERLLEDLSFWNPSDGSGGGALPAPTGGGQGGGPNGGDNGGRYAGGGQGAGAVTCTVRTGTDTED
jgi:hypothetical protein